MLSNSTPLLPAHWIHIFLNHFLKSIFLNVLFPDSLQEANFTFLLSLAQTPSTEHSTDNAFSAPAIYSSRSEQSHVIRESPNLAPPSQPPHRPIHHLYPFPPIQIRQTHPLSEPSPYFRVPDPPPLIGETRGIPPSLLDSSIPQFSHSQPSKL